MFASHPLRQICFIAIIMGGLTTALSSQTVVQAQKLSSQHYDVGSGLVSNDIRAIYQDSKGYVWFGGVDGLSRFDGYRFVNYGPDDGLPPRIITSLTEDAQGRLWIGTFGGGLARLIDDPHERSLQQNKAGKAQAKFEIYKVATPDSSNHVSTIGFARDGSLWCFSDGLYRATFDAAGSPRFELVVPLAGRTVLGP